MTTITDDTLATLTAHKVQAGDVVQIEYGHTYTVGVNSLGKLCDASDGVALVDAGPWTVISRATPAPLPHGHARMRDGRVVDLTADKMLPFGMLDTEVQEAMRAHGGPYEYYDGVSGWVAPVIGILWGKGCAYRVAPLPPAPKVETVTMKAHLEKTGWIYTTNFNGSLMPVTITFNLIDGKPDPASYKLEAR